MSAKGRKRTPWNRPDDCQLYLVGRSCAAIESRLSEWLSRAAGLNVHRKGGELLGHAVAGALVVILLLPPFGLAFALLAGLSVPLLELAATVLANVMRTHGECPRVFETSDRRSE